MDQTKSTTILWRRLDAPGHDACRVVTHAQGWEMRGTAVFLHQGQPARLTYLLEGDPGWTTRRGEVQGFLGNTTVDVRVARSPEGSWTFNGAAVPALDSYGHLDFSFTPATNFPHFRQLALAVGQAADLPVVWLELPGDGLQLLPQRYMRRTATAYWYEAPSVGYAALLELTEDGLILRYPDLWEREG